ncbi:MAG: tRNA uridine-5-carboxymethylaminomethyl(34) synthesis GTPase MnmE [Acidiferrobacteraceae bacterium]|jgi:tRNA modification GTPase|nr:tRNA uridine-5-carboxymethylaminomethyl(34) synthesis GTPase MnmE [Acidiferrobacteraceae bacterium]
MFYPLHSSGISPERSTPRKIKTKNLGPSTVESPEKTQLSEHSDTVVAISTPPGFGGIGIVRVSGQGAEQIALTLLGDVPRHRIAKVCRFRDGQQGFIDEGVALLFKGPQSYTGEDTLELYGHGGPMVMDLLVERILSMGARAARPGEFTERAFLNGKVDLTQAEAVADLIESRTKAAAQAALRSLSGQFSSELFELDSKLGELRASVEADIDFADEDLSRLEPETIRAQIDGIVGALDKLLNRARPGSFLVSGAVAVLVGPPNVGKSSVLNALSGQDRAIVSARPGTTRDLVEVDINLNGVPLRLIDTAGHRASPDPIEAEGIKRANRAIAKADLVLVVSDDASTETYDLNMLENTETPVFILINKCDLTGQPYGEILKPAKSNRSFAISATQQEGLEELQDAMEGVFGKTGGAEAPFAARRRHLDAIQRAKHCLDATNSGVTSSAIELLAEELRLAQNILGEITGRGSTEELLGQIFSRFCIGK